MNKFKAVHGFGLVILLNILPILFLFTDISTISYDFGTADYWIDFGYILSSVLAIIAVILFFWQIILGNRQITSFFTTDLIGINKLHKWLGIGTIVTVMLHPFLIMFYIGQDVQWLFSLPNFETEYSTHIAFGKFALYLLLIVWFSSFAARRFLSYRFWKWLHFLTYPLMFFALIHANDIGNYLGKTPILQVYWYILMIGLILIVITRIIFSFGIGKKIYTITNQKHQKDILIITLQPKNIHIVPAIGQYIYLQLQPFGESHPFSVMYFDTETHEITLGIKIFGSFTKKLANKELFTQVYLDGPYGIFTEEGHNSDPKVLIAGGIGVTPFVRLTQECSNSNTYMLHANKTIEHIIARDTLISKLGNRYVDCISQGNSIDEYSQKGRINKAKIEQLLPKELLLTSRYFVCGSPAFNISIKTLLISLGISKKNIYIENFSN